MEKQELRTFGRRHGKKLSTRKQFLIENVLPTISPKNIKTTGNKILEIGFGNGEHLCTLATNNPESIIVGAEPFINGVAALLSAITDDNNIVRNEYKNIYVWPDDVRKMFNETNILFDEIWVLHPDPWPKARHEKRRLLGYEFLCTLQSKLSNDGKIIIGTDHWEYFDWITENAKKTSMCIESGDFGIIKTRYQQKNKANTTKPKYMILTNQ